MNSIIPLLQQARKASISIRKLGDQQRRDVLLLLARAIEASEAQILDANQLDLDAMPDTDPKKDRLLLNADRIADLAGSIRQVAALEDPAGAVHLTRELQAGLELQKVSVPLGVVGVIYESRPNVTADVASLCLRSGNACVLKGGKEAVHSNTAIVDVIQQVLVEFGLPEAAVTLLPTPREHVQELLTATRYVDILIPRGSDSLIQFVRKNALVPTIETGAGVCHTYVAPGADIKKAAEIVVNAKVQRPSVCNALDTILVDRSAVDELLSAVSAPLQAHKVEIFADDIAFPILTELGYPYLQRATEEDFGREFLDLKCSVKVVSGVDEAFEHIETFSSRHSEAIITEDADLAERFLEEVDAAAVYVNASTRFTDGGEFGLGAEIGISTQKLHARGPFALEKLVTEKWVVRGNGHIRT
ncbi:MAG: glutamate-5-semialdehyde dehydrogenase [Bacteroidetes bacterium]|nr:glutamate-5-semialdehyde dehydrogenase [Bacteroidota bacterium]